MLSQLYLEEKYEVDDARFTDSIHHSASILWSSPLDTAFYLLSNFATAYLSNLTHLGHSIRLMPCFYRNFALQSLGNPPAPYIRSLVSSRR
ncbi:hypothetical protein ABKN59_004382 [Abortiporus biennis]